MKPRPPIYQTYTPFVEMWIKGKDILRGRDGRPRSLISFSHDIYVGHMGGMWTLEIFDPEYVAVEEILLSLGNITDSTEVAEQAYGNITPAAADAARHWVTQGAYFRYGYVGRDQSEIVTSLGPGGEKYFFGNVHAYVPSYQAEGTYITLRGDSLAGGVGTPKSRTYEATYEMEPYEVVKTVCEEEGWVFTVLPSTEILPDLPPEKQPVGSKNCDNSVDSTEEKPNVFRRREDQDSWSFLTEFCLKIKSERPEYGNYQIRWEARVDAAPENGEVPEEPTVYCFFGPENVNDTIVRSYVYLRDAKTDIISFTPNINVYMLDKGGAFGITYKDHDVRLGEIKIHFLDELNRVQKYFRESRPTIAASDPTRLLEAQKGIREFQDQEEENKTEGGQTGPQVIGPTAAPDPDAPWKEFTPPDNSRAKADFEMLNAFLGMRKFAQTATLEIFGDPSSELQPGKLIAIFVFVPREDDTVGLHWLSGVWLLGGVSHQLRAGSFTTTLELNYLGLNAGGVTTEAYFRALEDILGETGMPREGSQ